MPYHISVEHHLHFANRPVSKTASCTCFASLVFFVLLSSPAIAGEISGTVMSIDNLPIPGAQVTARKQGENLILAVQTQTDGRYRILGATEGVYLLIVAGPAHQQEIRRNIVVGSPDATVKMDIRIPLTQTERISLSSEETPPPFAYLPDLSAFRRRLTLEPHADSEVLREFSPHLNTFGGEFGALLKNDSVLQP